MTKNSLSGKTGFGEHFDAEYDALPESIKMVYSPKEYAWMQPEQRARLIEDETMPEVEE
jgi:hypothetical protein